MTPEQQREEIAKACGYVKLPNGDWRGPTMTVGSCGIPNYLGCLNAMNKAELQLAVKDNHAYGCYCSNLYEEWGNTVSLSAEVRAEMFLKTIGKWEEDK